MGSSHWSCRRTTSRLAVLGAVLVSLWACFPDARVAVAVIGPAFLFESAFDDPLLMLLPWSVLGAVAAWSANELACHLGSLPRSTSVVCGVAPLRIQACTCSLLFLAERTRISGRRLFFVVAVTIVCGIAACLASPERYRSQRDDHLILYRTGTGCYLGTILGTVRIIGWRSLRPANTQSLDSCRRSSHTDGTPRRILLMTMNHPVTIRNSGECQHIGFVSDVHRSVRVFGCRRDGGH